jgi:hypothetical protein
MKYLAAAVAGAALGWSIGVIVYFIISAIVWLTVYILEGYPK